MNKLINFILTIPFAAIIIVFALYNRHEIEVFINPLNLEANIIPAYIFGASTAILGLFWGSIMTWLSYSSKRKKIREQKKTIKSLEKELENSQNKNKENNKILIGK